MKKLIGMLFFLHINSAIAEIPFTVINGLHKNFIKKNNNGGNNENDKDFEALSPLFGFTLLKSNVVSNLRFYGNFKFDYKDSNGVATRNFSGDEGNDSITKLVRILFPSTGGQLTTISGRYDNLGKKLSEDNKKGIQFIALLLAYVYDFRKVGVSNLFDNIKNNIIKEKNEGLQELNKKLKELDSNKRSEINVLKQEIQNSKFKVEELNKTTDINKFLISFIEEKNNSFKGTIKDLIKAINESIKNENNSKYPKYLTEHLIVAFFWSQFNTREDLVKLIELLNPEKAIKRKEKIGNMEHAWNLGNKNAENLNIENFYVPEVLKDPIKDINDLKKIIESNKVNTEKFVQAYYGVDYFGSITPYIQGVAPISNGNCRCYDRARNKLCNNTFADCVEVSIRHLFNLLLFDKGIFDVENFLKNLKEFKENKDSIIKPIQAQNQELIQQQIDQNSPIEKLISFYKKQNTKELADNGSEDFRSAWNEVVGDVSGAVYIKECDKGSKKICELGSGLHNTIKLLEGILEVRLTKDDLNITFNTKGEYYKILIEKFNAFFKLFEKDGTTIEPEITLGNIINDTDSAWPGYFPEKLSVEVKYDNGDTFSFDLNANTGHQYLDNIKQQIKDDKLIEDIKKDAESTKVIGEFYNPIRIINKEDTTQSLYNLLSYAEDNNDKIEVLGKFKDKKLDSTELIVAENIIKTLQLEDENVAKNAFPVLLDLFIKNLELIEAIKGKEQYIFSGYCQDEDKKDLSEDKINILINLAKKVDFTYYRAELGFMKIAARYDNFFNNFKEQIANIIRTLNWKNIDSSVLLDMYLKHKELVEQNMEKYQLKYIFNGYNNNLHLTKEQIESLLDLIKKDNSEDGSIPILKFAMNYYDKLDKKLKEKLVKLFEFPAASTLGNVRDKAVLLLQFFRKDKDLFKTLKNCEIFSNISYLKENDFLSYVIKIFPDYKKLLLDIAECIDLEKKYVCTENLIKIITEFEYSDNLNTTLLKKLANAINSEDFYFQSIDFLISKLCTNHSKIRPLLSDEVKKFIPACNMQTQNAP